MHTIFHHEQGLTLQWLLIALGVLVTMVALAEICL